MEVIYRNKGLKRNAHKIVVGKPEGKVLPETLGVTDRMVQRTNLKTVC
jgi:hypothetical protein